MDGTCNHRYEKRPRLRKMVRHDLQLHGNDRKHFGVYPISGKAGSGDLRCQFPVSVSGFISKALTP